MAVFAAAGMLGLVSLPAMAVETADPRAQRPNAPTNVRGTPGDGSVKVSWKKSQNARVTGVKRYVATSQPGGKTCSVKRQATSCIVTGLTNGTPYTFTVVAVSSSGRSRPSRPSAPVTPTRTSGAPTAVAALAGDAQAAVTWKAPASTGSRRLLGYTATSSPEGRTCQVTVRSSTAQAGLRCVIRDLTNGTAYTFTVSAAYDDGTSATSSPSAPVTPRPQTSGVLAWVGAAPGSTVVPYVAQVPPEVQSPGVTAVSAARDNAAALKDGRVVYWGYPACDVPVPAELNEGVTALANGGDHALAVKAGRAFAWGCNTDGQSTVPPEARSGVTAIAASPQGSRYSLAVKDGGVIGWGLDWSDVLRVPAAANSGVTAVGAGATFAMALKDGGVIAWGGNSYGETDVPADALSGVSAIAAGPSYGLALKDGRVIAWGSNTVGQTEVPQAAQSGVSAIAAGPSYALAIKDGQVIIWGGAYLQTADIPPLGQSGIVVVSGADAEVAFLVKG